MIRSQKNKDMNPKTDHQIDWKNLRKKIIFLTNKTNQSDVLNIFYDGGKRFVAACQTEKRILFPMNWTKETILETLNPVTQSFQLKHWNAIVDHTNSARIRQYSLEMALVTQINLLEEIEWKIYKSDCYQIGRVLQACAKFPEMLKKFPDELVMVFERGYLEHAKTMHDLTVQFCAQVVVLDHLLNAARSIKFTSLVTDFIRIKQQMLQELPRLALCRHEFFLKQMADEKNYNKSTAFATTTLFKLLFCYQVWKLDSECAHQLNSIIQQSLFPESVLPMFELLLSCDEAKQRTFHPEVFHEHHELLYVVTKVFSDEYGLDVAQILGSDDLIRLVGYLTTKVQILAP